MNLSNDDTYASCLIYCTLKTVASAVFLLLFFFWLKCFLFYFVLWVVVPGSCSCVFSVLEKQWNLFFILFSDLPCGYYLKGFVL